MSNHNKANLKANYGKHNEPQKHKNGPIFFIIYTFLMAFLITSLLIQSCQQTKPQEVTYEQ